MGSLFYVRAIKAPDELWRKHKAVWDACEAVGIDPPEETERFFEGFAPADEGVVVSLGDADEPRHPAASRREDTFVVDLSRLPKGSTHVLVEW